MRDSYTPPPVPPQPIPPWPAPAPPIGTPPDPIQVARWTGQVRLVLTMLAGAGIGAAWIPKLTDQQIGGYVGLALFALPTAAAVWSWVENTWNARHANATVVASAVASANASARSGVATPLAVVPSPSRYAPALIAIPETPAPLPLH